MPLNKLFDWSKSWLQSLHKVHSNTISNGELSDPLCDSVNVRLKQFIYIKAIIFQNIYYLWHCLPTTTNQAIYYCNLLYRYGILLIYCLGGGIFDFFLPLRRHLQVRSWGGSFCYDIIFFCVFCFELKLNIFYCINIQRDWLQICTFNQIIVQIHKENRMLTKTLH